MTRRIDLQADLELAGIEINGIVQSIKGLYPELEKFNIIKRLIAASDKWNAQFDRIYSKGRMA